MEEEISQVESGVAKLENLVDKSGKLCDDEARQDIQKVVECLHQQAAAIQENAEITKKHADKDLARWEEFLNGVNNISVLVEEVRMELEDVIEDQISPAQVMIYIYYCNI